MVQFISAAATVVFLSSSVVSFSPAFISSSPSKYVVPIVGRAAAGPTVFRKTMLTLSAAESDEDAASTAVNESVDEAVGEVVDEAIDEQKATVEEDTGADEEVSTSADEEVEASSTKVEDEVVAKYRAAISSLEATLRSKNMKISSIKESASRYSKNGTLRLVAELADFKKSRARTKVSDEARGKARKIEPFLAVMDELAALEGTFSDDTEKVAKQFGSLGRDLQTNLGKVGLKSFGAEIGSDRYIISRYTAISKEYSDTIPEGYITKVLVEGLEIEGNIVRDAEVVVSLGVKKEEADEKADETVDEKADEKAEEEKKEDLDDETQ